MGREQMEDPRQAARIRIDMGGVNAPVQPGEAYRMVVRSVERDLDNKVTAIQGLREEIRRGEEGEVYFSAYDGAIRAIYSDRNHLVTVQINWVRAALLLNHSMLPANFDSAILRPKDSDWMKGKELQPEWFIRKMAEEGLEMQIALMGLDDDTPPRVGYRIVGDEESREWVDRGDAYDVVLDDVNLTAIPVKGESRKKGWVVTYFYVKRESVDIGLGVGDTATMLTMQRRTNIGKVLEAANFGVLGSQRFADLWKRFNFQAITVRTPNKGRTRK